MSKDYCTAESRAPCAATVAQAPLPGGSATRGFLEGLYASQLLLGDEDVHPRVCASEEGRCYRRVAR